MAALFDSGRIVDWILVAMFVEAAILCGLAARRRGRVPIAGLVLNLAAGGCLLLALRAVLTDAGWIVSAVWLALALVAHAGDVALRLRS